MTKKEKVSAMLKKIEVMMHGLIDNNVDGSMETFDFLAITMDTLIKEKQAPKPLRFKILEDV